MAWDATRPVPWQRLVREWLIYVAVMAAIFVLFFRDRGLVGVFAGLLVSGPLYLLVGYVLAKFGYQRKTLKQMRAESASPTGRSRDTADDTSRTGPRPKPAPTSRTGGSSARPTSRKKRRR